MLTTNRTFIRRPNGRFAGSIPQTKPSLETAALPVLPEREIRIPESADDDAFLEKWDLSKASIGISEPNKYPTEQARKQDMRASLAAIAATNAVGVTGLIASASSPISFGFATVIAIPIVYGLCGIFAQNYARAKNGTIANT